MIELKLPDMSCGHCVAAVTQAAREVDPQAKVEVDLGSKQVTIDSSRDRRAFTEALAEAGYPAAD